MAGCVDHIIINVNDFDTSCPFYDWLMPELGYADRVVEFPGFKGWVGKAGGFFIKQAAAQFANDTFNKDRVGVCEIAFHSDGRELIDSLAPELEAHGARILDPPQEYNYAPGYYAVFFIDPDGIKLEVVHIPSPA